MSDDDCNCGWTPSATFPAKPAKGDRCPIGPFNLHHWHAREGHLGERQCVFCSRTQVRSQRTARSGSSATTTAVSAQTAANEGEGGASDDG